MNRNILFSLLLAGLPFFLSCGNEAAEQVDQTANDIAAIRDNGIVLKNGEVINMPSGMVSEQTILFIIRHGESVPSDDIGMPILTEAGKARAQRLVNLFKSVKLSNVLAGMSHHATEFGRPVAEDHDVEVLNYNARDYGAFLDYIYMLEPGRKYLVIGYADSVPDMLNVLTAGKQFPLIPEGDYNDMYVVFTTNRGNAKVYALDYE